ncbi:MAG: InlB B-repeat-containing protein [Treponema sp.]|nr:InlB B-repeat-containing protein [Candidatus Treponema equifaecale]
MKRFGFVKKLLAFAAGAFLFASCSNILSSDIKDSENANGLNNVKIHLGFNEPSETAARATWAPSSLDATKISNISISTKTGSEEFVEKLTATSTSDLATKTLTIAKNTDVKALVTLNSETYSGTTTYTTGDSISITLAADSTQGKISLDLKNAPSGKTCFVAIYETSLPETFNASSFQKVTGTTAGYGKATGTYQLVVAYKSGDTLASINDVEGTAFETVKVEKGFTTVVTPEFAAGVASIYTVTFNVYYEGGENKTVRVASGKTVTAPTVSRSGYTFKGWYTDTGCTTSAVFTNITSNKTFYAKWEEFVPPTKITLVKNGNSSEYETIKEALTACGSSGDCQILLPVGTYNENGLTYNGSGTIRITGTGTAARGIDVVIKGHGSTMPVDDVTSAQNARELLLFKGTGNLILENLTLQSDWLRSEHPGVKSMQAEVLGFNSSGTVAAYNCSFKSYQDTVRTVGKAWFYDCHIEGDVDFIWMEAGGKVALYEKCDIASVYDGASSAAYIAAPKINLGNVAGKGVVIKDCTVTAAANQQTYLFRNPWNDKPTAQYNQAAYVDCTYNGTFVAGLSKSDANGTADQQYIGWKIDSAAASKFTGKSSKIGVLSDAVKSKEYSGRRAILNRNYIVDSAKFEKDTSSNWDIDSFISTVGWNVQEDTSKDKYDGEVEKIYAVWNFAAMDAGAVNIQGSSKSGTVATTGTDNKTYTLSVNTAASGGKLYTRGSANSDAQFNSGTTIKVPVTVVGSVIDVSMRSGTSYTLAGTSGATSYTVTQTDVTAGWVEISATGSCYLSSISLSFINGGSESPSKTLSSIAVTTLPSKVSYTVGESLVTTGMVVTATYSDNSTETVTGWTVDTTALSTAGSKTVTVSYDGKTTTFTVNVTDVGGEEDWSWIAKDYKNQTIESSVTLGKVTIAPHSGTTTNYVSIIERNKAIDSVAYTKSLSLGGTGSKDARNMKFTLTGAATVKVAAQAGGSGDRKLVLASSGKTYGEILTTQDGSLIDFSYDGSGEDVYVYSSSSGIHVYAVYVEYGTPAPRVTLNKTTLSINETATETLAATVSNATNTAVTWSSDRPSVATVENGVVTGVSAGTAIITATSVADSTKSASCTVTVAGLATALSVGGGTAVQIEKTLTLTARPNGPVSGTPVYTWSISSGSSYGTLSSSTTDSVILTAGSTEGEVTVNVSCSNGKTTISGTVTIHVSKDAPVNKIKYTDKPLGFAGVNYTLPSFTAAKTVTVSTRADLVKYATTGGYLIYIDGMIDMSDEGTGSKLPAVGASNIAVSSVMDNWIASKTSNNYKTYAEWVEAYAAVCTSTSANDKEKNPSKGSNTSLYETVWALNKEWQTIIEIKPKSNTTIIGLGNNSGIRGGTINISGVSNVVIRNLTLIDAIDMFPHHEYNDGFNAQFDCITIQGSNTANIWIDHCTMKDTLVMQHVKSGTKEKWQNYDGLCDIKGDGKGITVSNCHMYHHDKTMLVGSSDDEGDNTKRKVSIINNHFDSCVQRLPMARNSQFHVLNNWYSFDTAQSVGDGKHQGDYCIGARKGALIISEANYFDSNMQYSIRGNSDTASTTQVYDTGSEDKNSKKTNEYTAVTTAPFTVPYSYTPMTATEAKTYVEDNAGANKWPVEQ